MKKLSIFVLVLGLVISSQSVCFSKELKIGYVNVFKVFNEYAKTKEYDEKLEKNKKEAEKKLEAKKETIEKLQNKLSLLKEKERSSEEEKMKKEITEYRETERKALIDIKKERDEKMKEIIEDINKVVEDYAKKNKFDLVVNESSVLYGDKAMDITSDIMKLANKQYKSK
jgi:outer membrane protein